MTTCPTIKGKMRVSVIPRISFECEWLIQNLSARRPKIGALRYVKLALGRSLVHRRGDRFGGSVCSSVGIQESVASIRRLNETAPSHCIQRNGIGRLWQASRVQ